MNQQQREALAKLGYVKKEQPKKLENKVEFSEDVKQHIATEYKGYFTKWDKQFLMSVFTQGIHTEKQQYLFDVIMKAITKRKEEGNNVIDLTEEQIEVIEANKHYYNPKQKEWYDTISTKFFFSYTKKMTFMVEQLLSAHKQVPVKNYFD
jgi:hypothetical protein